MFYIHTLGNGILCILRSGHISKPLRSSQNKRGQLARAFSSCYSQPTVAILPWPTRHETAGCSQLTMEQLAVGEFHAG